MQLSMAHRLLNVTNSRIVQMTRVGAGGRGSLRSFGRGCLSIHLSVSGLGVVCSVRLRRRVFSGVSGSGPVVNLFSVVSQSGAEANFYYLLPSFSLKCSLASYLPIITSTTSSPCLCLPSIWPLC